jgi:hypothetical protein
MIQRQFELLGKGGCYFFCLWKLARDITGTYKDPYRLYIEAVDKGFLTEDCWVQDPAKLMELATEQLRWTVFHAPPEYQPAQGEYEILRYEWKTTTGQLAHFVLPDWDPYGDSLTRRYGVIVSKRILRRM